MPKRVFRSDWRPAVFTLDDTVFIQIALGAIALIRAADYMATTTDEYLGVIEKAMPLAVWSVMCLATGGLLLTGITMRSHSRVWAGHVLGWMTYTALSVGSILLTFDKLHPVRVVQSMPIPVWYTLAAIVALSPTLLACIQRRLYPSSPRPVRTAQITALIVGGLCAVVGVLPFESIRSVGPLMVIAVTHLLFALRTGARPITRAEATVDIHEVTVAPADSA